MWISLTKQIGGGQESALLLWRCPPHFASCFKLPKCVDGSFGRIIRPPAKDPTTEVSDPQATIQDRDQSGFKRNALARKPGGDFPNNPRSAHNCMMSWHSHPYLWRPTLVALSGNIFQRLLILSLSRVPACVIPLVELVNVMA